MNTVEILGFVGVLLFFIKIAVHVFIKRKVDKWFHLGAFGQYSNPVLFFPITDDVTGYLKPIKKVGNVSYFIAIVLILIFVIGTNLHRKNVPSGSTNRSEALSLLWPSPILG